MDPLNPLLAKTYSRRESWEVGPSSFGKKKSPVIFQYLWSTHGVKNCITGCPLLLERHRDSRDGKWTRDFMRTEFWGEHLRHGSSNRCHSHPRRSPLGCVAPSLTVNMQSSIPGNQRFSLERVQRWELRGESSKVRCNSESERGTGTQEPSWVGRAEGHS